MRKMKIVAKLKPEDAEKKYFEGMDNIEIEGGFTIRNADDENALYEDYYDDDEDDNPTPCGLRQPLKAKDWTVGDVLEAKHIVIELVKRLTLDGYSISWIPNHKAGTVSVEIRHEDGHASWGHCYANDGCYNEWTSKCMALCQACHHAYPAFAKGKTALFVSHYDEDDFEDGEPEFSPLWEHM